MMQRRDCRARLRDTSATLRQGSFDCERHTFASSLAARKRNISARGGNQDNKDSTTTARNNNKTPSKTSRAIAIQNAQNYHNDAKAATASRTMNILVTLFMIAMLNPLLFNALHFLQSYNNIQHKLTPKRDFPYEWESYTYNDIREYFNCRQRSKDMDKSLATLDDWNLLRKAYTLIVDSTKKRGMIRFRLQKDIHLNKAKLFHHRMPNNRKGRDVDYSPHEILKRGSWSIMVRSVISSFPDMVFSLPRDFACDCTDWHWMQMKHEGDDYHMVAALDISVLMNSGGEEFGPGRTPNVLPEDKYSGKQFALRDIVKDEEILTDYDAYWTDWSEVGL